MNSFVTSNFKTLYNVQKCHGEFELTRSLALLLVRNYIEKIVRKERGMSELANNASFGRRFYFELGVYPSSYSAMTPLIVQ